MVAYTSPDCLPYLTGSDSLCVNTGTVCDPSTVWCDFAELVDDKLTAYDDIVQRTAQSVPMAWIETTDLLSFVADDAVQPVFTTVRNDTDNMVDLDTFNNGFTVNTSGLYTLWAYMYGTLDAANVGSMTPQYTLLILPATSPAPIFSFNSTAPALTANLIVTTHTQLVTPIGAGQTVSMQISSGGLVTNRANLTKIAMGATWVGDLP